jgi:hypothetical protein
MSVVGAACSRAGDRPRGRARRNDRDTLVLLIENVAREQLTPVEEARAFAAARRVQPASAKSRRVGRSKPSVSNRIRPSFRRRARARPATEATRAPCPQFPITRADPAREIVQKGLSSAAEQRAAGGAKQKPRVRASAVDPRLQPG